MPPLPVLFVEGKDDISVISNLLARNGVLTEQGARHLRIQDEGNDDGVLNAIPLAIRASSDRPVGFVIDIDSEVADRWQAVSTRVREGGGNPPGSCPAEGYIDTLPEYPFPFGV